MSRRDDLRRAPSEAQGSEGSIASEGSGAALLDLGTPTLARPPAPGRLLARRRVLQLVGVGIGVGLGLAVWPRRSYGLRRRRRDEAAPTGWFGHC